MIKGNDKNCSDHSVGSVTLITSSFCKPTDSNANEYLKFIFNSDNSVITPTYYSNSACTTQLSGCDKYRLISGECYESVAVYSGQFNTSDPLVRKAPTVSSNSNANITDVTNRKNGYVLFNTTTDGVLTLIKTDVIYTDKKDNKQKRFRIIEDSLKLCLVSSGGSSTQSNGLTLKCYPDGECTTSTKSFFVTTSSLPTHILFATKTRPEKGYTENDFLYLYQTDNCIEINSNKYVKYGVSHEKVGNQTQKVFIYNYYKNALCTGTSYDENKLTCFPERMTGEIDDYEFDQHIYCGHLNIDTLQTTGNFSVLSYAENIFSDNKREKCPGAEKCSYSVEGKSFNAFHAD